MSKHFMHTMMVSFGALFIGTAYADTVDNPGAISFTGNSDSHVASFGGGSNMYTNQSSGLLIAGSVDSNGNMFFDQADISADVYEDPNGYRTQLQATDDATGTFCPNSGAATISMSARIRVTKYAGTSIATTPCYITFNSGTNAFTLTTGTSGSLSGASFNSSDPSLIAEVTLDATISGATCPAAAKTAISNYYGLATTPLGRVWLPGASVSPTNLTGNGC